MRAVRVDAVVVGRFKTGSFGRPVSLLGFWHRRHALLQGDIRHLPAGLEPLPTFARRNFAVRSHPAGRGLSEKIRRAFDPPPDAGCQSIQRKCAKTL